MKIIDDFSNNGHITPSAGCVCNKVKDNHTDTKGWWNPIFACNRSCIGIDNRDANKNCAKKETNV